MGHRLFMKRYSIPFGVVYALAVLCGCGGKNGFCRGGQGNSVSLTSITMTPANPTVALSVAHNLRQLSSSSSSATQCWQSERHYQPDDLD